MNSLNKKLQECERADALAKELDAKAEQKPAPTPNAVFKDEAKKLAALSPMEYDRVREAKAEALEVRVSTLDKEVKKHRPSQDDTTAELFNDAEPWPEWVNGPEILSEIRSAISRYVFLSGKAGDAITLWVIHAHAYRAFHHSPRLNPYSPEKGCGKTTLLDVMQALTPKALRTENVTTAVLFRLIDAYAPTLLVDEYDTFLKDNDELRGALNAGHRQGGKHLRCEGDDNKIKAFSTFAPVALAGIRELPGTLSDRSIKIRMQRAKPDEIKARFDARSAASLGELKRKAARWAKDHLSKLEQADPDMGGLYNRVADNWRPLFAIAELIGGDWPEKVKQAAAELNKDTDTQGTAILLLEDLAELFSKRDKLTSAEICEHLAGFKERPWPAWNHGIPINPQQVSKLLRPFGIKPAVIRIGDKTPRGYERSQFVEVFERYVEPATPQQDGKNRDSQDFRGATPVAIVAGQKSPEPLKNRECCGVAGQKPEGWETEL